MEVFVWFNSIESGQVFFFYLLLNNLIFFFFNKENIKPTSSSTIFWCLFCVMDLCSGRIDEQRKLKKKLWEFINAETGMWALSIRSKAFPCAFTSGKPSKATFISRPEAASQKHINLVRENSAAKVANLLCQKPSFLSKHINIRTTLEMFWVFRIE